MNFGDCTSCNEYKHLGQDNMCKSCREGINGVVTLDDSRIENATIDIFDGGGVVKTVTTDSDGSFNVTDTEATHIVVNVEQGNVYASEVEYWLSDKIRINFDSSDAVRTEIDGKEILAIYGTNRQFRAVTNIHLLQAIDDAPFNNYTIVRDIDATPTHSWDSGFTPIESFNGIMYGFGHGIEHLHIDGRGHDAVGLFRSISSDSLIEGLHFKHVSLLGGDVVGVLTAKNSGTVRIVSVAGVVESDGFATGGVVGHNSSRLVQVEQQGIVNGGDIAGGLVGINFGEMLDCYSQSDVYADESAGGLIGELKGYARFTGLLMSAYSTGDVSRADNCGGLVGSAGGGRIHYSYWCVNPAGKDGVGHREDTVYSDVRALTEQEMTGERAQEMMGGLSWSKEWTTTDSYPDIV